MISIIQILKQLLSLFPPRFGQTLLLLGCVSMIAPVVFLYGVDALEDSEIPTTRIRVVGVTLIAIGASLYTLDAVIRFITEFALFFSASISWIEGIAAVTFLAKVFGALEYASARTPSQGVSNFHLTIPPAVTRAVHSPPIERIVSFLRPRLIKYLLLTFVALIANLSAGWALYLGILRGNNILSIVVTTLTIQSVAGALASTIGIAWKLRHTTVNLSPIIAGFLVAVFGVNIYGFVSLTTDLLNYLISATVFAIAYVVGISLVTGRGLTVD